MIGNERKQLIERELGIHPIGVLEKKEKQTCWEKKGKRGGTSIFFSAQNVGR